MKFCRTRRRGASTTSRADVAFSFEQNDARGGPNAAKTVVVSVSSPRDGRPFGELLAAVDCAAYGRGTQRPSLSSHRYDRQRDSDDAQETVFDWAKTKKKKKKQWAPPPVAAMGVIKKTPSKVRGPDKDVFVEVDWNDLDRGCRRDVSLTRRYLGKEKKLCKATKKYDIDVRPGEMASRTWSFEGDGDVTAESYAGDVRVSLRVAPHPFLLRRGCHVTLSRVVEVEPGGRFFALVETTAPRPRRETSRGGRVGPPDSRARRRGRGVGPRREPPLDRVAPKRRASCGWGVGPRRAPPRNKRKTRTQAGRAVAVAGVAPDAPGVLDVRVPNEGLPTLGMPAGTRGFLSVKIKVAAPPGRRSKRAPERRVDLESLRVREAYGVGMRRCWISTAASRRATTKRRLRDASSRAA